MIKLNLLKRLKFSNKRVKVFLLALFTFFIFIPFLVFAFNTVDTGYQRYKNHASDLIPLFWNATTTPGVISTSTTGVCVYNSTSNDYFIPTRTLSEWTNFFDHKPAGLTLMQCKGDKACTLNGSGGYGGGETCSNAPEDCGACAVTCPPGNGFV